MSGWVVVLACAACSSHASETTKPAGEPAKPVTVAEAPKSPAAPPPPRKPTLQIERQLPDAGWERAVDAALPLLKPWLESESSFQRLVFKPLTAPDGSQIPHLLVYEAFNAKGSEYKASMLIADGKLVGLGGQADATRYLHSIGFPGKKIDRGLLLEVLLLSRVATAGWASSPAAFGWPDAFDDSGARLGRERGILTYDKDGATFTLYRPRPAKIQEEQHLADRLVLRFDKDAAITISSAREEQNKSWTSIPPAP